MKNILIGVCVGAMVLAACGGSSKATPAGGGSSTTTNAGGPATTAKPGGGSGGGSDAFQLLAEKSTSANVKVTYTTSEGKSLTLEQDGTGKVAIVSDGSLVIVNGTQVVTCDGTTAAAKCTNLGSLGAIAATFAKAFTSVLTSISHLKSSVYGGHTSSATIAGRDATCVSFKASELTGLAALSANKAGTNPNASAEVCADNQTGFPLKIAGTDGTTATTNYLVATAAGDASPSDFIPPSTPVTIPAIKLPPGVTLPPGVSIPSAP